jgi:hypothetical protein
MSVIRSIRSMLFALVVLAGMMAIYFGWLIVGWRVRSGYPGRVDHIHTLR